MPKRNVPKREAAALAAPHSAPSVTPEEARSRNLMQEMRDAIPPGAAANIARSHADRGTTCHRSARIIMEIARATSSQPVARGRAGDIDDARFRIMVVLDGGLCLKSDEIARRACLPASEVRDAMDGCDLFKMDGGLWQLSLIGVRTVQKKKPRKSA